MKKILITEEQDKLIQEAIELNKVHSQLPTHLLSAIKDGNTPLSNCPSFLPNTIETLLTKSFKKTIDEFSDDITSYSIDEVNGLLNKLTVKCIKKEEKVRKQLTDLCAEIVNQIFNIPEEGVSISCELKDDIPSTTNFHIDPNNNEEYEYDDVSAIETDNSEVEKRKLLNTLIVGMAMKIADNARKEFLPEIFEIDEELPHLYNKVMKINDYLLFVKEFEIKDGSHKQGGYVETKLGSDMSPTQINAYGIIFPILLYETIRGCLELFISHGLPDDRSSAERVINKADALKNDPWYTRVGVSLYNYDIPTKSIPTFLMNLSMIDSQEFFSITKEIIANTKKGKELIQNLIASANYDDDYDLFQNDMRQKQADNKNLIEDDYFSEEELNEWRND